LKSKIISNKVNKCIDISIEYNYTNNNLGSVLQTWKFDIRNKSDISFWFASEADEVHILLI
jgi:hypothetical protein